MTETNCCDVTWEEFFGSSQELLPSIMGAFDAIINNNVNDKPHHTNNVKSSPARRSHQVNNFATLSPCVQKILSNLPDQEISKNFSSEENLGPKRNKFAYRSIRSPERSLQKSKENLEIISPNVQKMLSNLPDDNLVITPGNNKPIVRNNSYLYTNSNNRCDYSNNNGKGVSAADVQICNDKQFVNCAENGNNSECDQLSGNCESEKYSENSDSYSQRPLGNYLHTSPHGIASRTPVGRKNMGKYLQVPSESSVGTISSSTSSEVSRPVSLTSLASCSSSGSSGHHQPGSAYLASAESLDSDPEPNGSQGSADSGIAEQPSMSPELRVLQEVLDTETVYVADLNEVIQGYFEPWKCENECPLAQHLHHLFSNITEIYEFNRSFLDELRKYDCDPTKIANVFVQNNSGFSVYNEYCTNYPRTMDILGQLTRDEKMAPLFREKQIALGHALPLGSYLLKPVQRILKYHLLLQRLSKQCESHHKPAVDLALTTMTGIATGINNMKRKHEHAVRVQEIQSQLYGWTGPDLTALGELIAEGTFRVMGARGRRHVFLFEQVLLLAKNKQDGALSYKSHIMCSNLMLVEQVRGEPLSFQVLPFDNPRLQCTLRARSPQQKREWTLQIKQVMLENFSAEIPNHARQLVMELGQDLNETEDTTDKWSPLKQHSTPHYLERRSRVRKTRDYNRRASSQDRTFPSLGNWRRKSEPNMIPQYTAKTIPKKITKIKRAKETGGSTFYTDLSDSEPCDIIGESIESLPQTLTESPSKPNLTEELPVQEKSVEKIVSELLMQNLDFQKILNRQRRVVNSEPGPSSWFEDRVKPQKADSLPRSFQLNDQIDGGEESKTKNDRFILDKSLKENPDDIDEELHENDLSSQLNDDNEHPDHKIYRKSVIRLSLLKRIRHILSEEQRRIQKFPIHKQGSKSMGEKIAHPDYADPQKLFNNSRNPSQTNLNTINQADDFDPMGEREQLDMTINEKDVLNELEKRLSGSTNSNNNHVSDTGQNLEHSSQIKQTIISKNETCVSSSQNSDSYYESLLDNSLTEEYITDELGRKVAKQDSFNSTESKIVYTHKYRVQNSYLHGDKKMIKRPTKAPPPIPTKPSRLVSPTANKNSVEINSSEISCNRNFLHVSSGQGTTSTSWVKTMVGRFE